MRLLPFREDAQQSLQEKSSELRKTSWTARLETTLFSPFTNQNLMKRITTFWVLYFYNEVFIMRISVISKLLGKT
jgi:hypothetical protein